MFFFSTPTGLLAVLVNNKNLRTKPSPSFKPLFIYLFFRIHTETSNIISGVLQYVEDASEFKPLYSQTVAVIEPTVLNKETVDTLMSHSKVSGIAVLWKTLANATGPAAAYSPDAPILNKDAIAGYAPTFAWNAHGDSLNFGRYRKPMWLLAEKDSEAVRGAAEANTRLTNGHYGMAFHSQMNAGVDSETCLRRGMCLPMGGQSIVSSLENATKEGGGDNDDEREVVYVTSRMDTTSMFHDLTPGSEGYVSGLIVQLAAQITLAELLRNDSSPALLKQDDLKRKLVFAYFNGEAYDYLGSKKFVHDLESFEVKKKKNIHHLYFIFHTYNIYYYLYTVQKSFKEKLYAM